MPDLIKTKDVKARKAHVCETCNDTAVQPGETYTRDTYVYDGRMYDWVQCVACSAIVGIVYEWAGCPDEGVARDDYVEWARESATADTLEGERARWYLARVGLMPHPADPSPSGPASQVERGINAPSRDHNEQEPR